jgi:hypothetical protein
VKTPTEWADEIIKRVRLYGEISIDAESDVQEAFEKAVKDAFRCGFEHAVAGGEESSKKVGIPKHALPVVAYFANEKDRLEFVDACKAVLQTEIKIPERSK